MKIKECYHFQRGTIFVGPVDTDIPLIKGGSALLLLDGHEISRMGIVSEDISSRLERSILTGQNVVLDPEKLSQGRYTLISD